MFLGNFCKGVKMYLFLLKSFLGNFYRHLAIFFWSHWSKTKKKKMLLLDSFQLDSLHNLGLYYGNIYLGTFYFLFQQTNDEKLYSYFTEQPSQSAPLLRKYFFCGHFFSYRSFTVTFGKIEILLSTNQLIQPGLINSSFWLLSKAFNR